MRERILNDRMQMKNLNKKAYYFTLDAFIAVVILAAGYYLIISTATTAPETSTVEHYSDDVLDLLSSAKVKDFCDLNTKQCSSYTSLNNFKNEKNTVLETLGEKYYNGGTSCDSFCISSNIQPIIQQMIVDNNIIPSDYSFAIYIEGIKIYGDETGIGKTKLLVSSKKIIFGYYEDSGTGSITPWGPYTVEVKTWQK